MPRGGHRVKPAKVAQVDATANAIKPVRKNSSWGAALTTASFLSRNYPDTKSVVPLPVQAPPMRDSSPKQDVQPSLQAFNFGFAEDPSPAPTDVNADEEQDEALSSLPDIIECSARPAASRTSSGLSSCSEQDLEPFEDLTNQDRRSSVSSYYSRDSSTTYSRDSSSIYARDSASIYSSASSIYSSEASIYSYEGDSIAGESGASFDPRLPPGRQQQQLQRARLATLKRQETLDPAARERSSLAKKAAMYKNSTLPPHLPKFGTSLSTWAMICRAAQASQDCYGSQALARTGSYTPADPSKDIKAMIVDEQSIDETRLVIVSIRGTEFRSLTDWTVNKAKNPTKPTGFLDDEENACHEGFLQVAKAMVSHVAEQLEQHPAISAQPTLLFTGHSAGGAVAALLCSHMMSTAVSSDLTALAGRFASINCVTFGAPPLAVSPPARHGLASGIFLAFANEGDPVVRIGNAAYAKSLAKLMTSSPPSSVTTETATQTVKVVRRSRGSAVVLKPVTPATQVTPWEELPLWPTPPAPLANIGDIILLRDSKESGRAQASQVTTEDLSDVIFGDLGQHTIEAYKRRIKELALAAMTGRH